MYCALYSKLWRLSSLLSRQRNVVNTKRASVPFISVVFAGLVVLVIWETAGDTEWEREIISYEPLETTGECATHHTFEFLIPLLVLIVLAVVATTIYSWKLRNVQEELSEARWIFAGILCHMQCWLVGLPVLFLVDQQSKEASYLVQVSLAFAFSTSMVALVIWPKAYRKIRDEHFDWAGYYSRKRFKQ